jgi:hypothetical protein
MSRYQRWFILSLSPLLAILSGCGRASPGLLELKAATQPEATPRAREADDAGRFIAGLPGTAGSPFASLEASEAWQEHRRRLDASWGRAEAGLITGIREFQTQELAGSPILSSTVFYPFGGPDALVATVCFPNSPAYVMVGLEPAGTLPTATQIERRKDLPKYLAEIRETMASELGRSFFITHQMDQQFRGQVTDGLLLPILHLLVRTQDTILGFRYVRVDEDGDVIERTPDYKALTRFGNKGIEIEFRTDSNRSVHKLYYFSVNLSDARLRENKPFLAYLSRLKGTTTLLKATSYMTHRPEFSLIRDVMLANSAAILQDDSGIPYRWFQPNLWTMQLYGNYDHPYGSFRWLEQPDLRKAYNAQGPKPLSMRIGYGYSKIASNLLLARRASAVASTSHSHSAAGGY